MTSAGVRTHDNDDVVNFAITLCINTGIYRDICKDDDVTQIWLFDSFEYNHAKVAKERDVYRL